MPVLLIMFPCTEPLLCPVLTFKGSMWTLNQPLLFCSKPTSQASSLIQQRTSLRVVKQVRFKRQVRPSFHQGDSFFPDNYFVGNVMKIAPSFLLADVMDVRSGSRHTIGEICMSFIDASQGKHSGRFPRTCDRSSGRSNIRDGFETRSLHINSLPLQRH